jgi:hypothetical protein
LEQKHKLQKFSVELCTDISNVVTTTAKTKKKIRVLLKIVTTTTFARGGDFLLFIVLRLTIFLRVACVIHSYRVPYCSALPAEYLPHAAGLYYK